MRTYKIKKVTGLTHEVQDLWEGIPSICIDNFPWDSNGYKPETKVSMFYTDEFIKIRFTSSENDIKAEYLRLNEPVYKDSCVEFFFKADPQKDDRYMNFEINAIGTLLLGFGRNRNERSFIEVDPEIFNIKTSVNRDSRANYEGGSWTVEYSIPFSFIEKYYGKIDFKSGHVMTGNFYKCGDETSYPHYGCWNPIERTAADFHRPEFFGKLIFE